MVSIALPQERHRSLTPAPAIARLVAAFVAVVLTFAGIGLLVVHVLAHGAVGHDERGFERTLAHDRTPTWNALTHLTTWLAETPTIVLLTALVAITARIVWKRWRDFFFVAVAVAGETAAFVTVTFFVHRSRPPVPHLDPAPPTSSFPSGHTAAAVAFYGAVAVLCSARVRHSLLSALLWALAVLVPLVVAASRMYRGMHFPTDVAAGALLGATWLAVTAMTLGPRAGARTGPHR